MEPTVELPDLPAPPDPRRWTVIVAALCVLVALGGGFTAGWIAHERSQSSDFREQLADVAVCVLDVLIEPSPNASPEQRFDVWTEQRLVIECGLTPERAADIREETP